jgi:hypothetical protein
MSFTQSNLNAFSAVNSVATVDKGASSQFRYNLAKVFPPVLFYSIHGE